MPGCSWLIENCQNRCFLLHIAKPTFAHFAVPRTGWRGGADWRGDGGGGTRFPQMAGLQNVLHAVAVQNPYIIACIILVAIGPKAGFVDPPAGMPRYAKTCQYRGGCLTAHVLEYKWRMTRASFGRIFLLSCHPVLMLHGIMHGAPTRNWLVCTPWCWTGMLQKYYARIMYA